MDTYLNMIKEDLQRLKDKSKILFESWRDESADAFNQQCLDHVQRMVARYIETVTPLCRHIERMELQMRQQLANSKKR